MYIVTLTALGVGGATVAGAVIGFAFRKISHKFSDTVLAFAAGVMLSASFIGLILPSLGYGGKWGFVTTVCGVFAGAVAVDLLDKLVPHLHRLAGFEQETHNKKALEKTDKVLLFVLAIAIHNFPEGLAAGVGFGTDFPATALLIAGGIALQNIPEGMVIISPMLSCGISPKRTLFFGVMTGVIEIIGTFVGYFAVSVSKEVLPFALAFAGGTMLFVISDEMIPETHADGSARGATYALIAGFCLMTSLSELI